MARSIRLDNPIFAGRVRDFTHRPTIYRRRALPNRGLINDVIGQRPKLVSAKPKRIAHNYNRKPHHSQVLRREVVTRPRRRQKKQLITKSRLLMSMAVMLFAVGITVSLQTIRQNHQTVGQVKALSKQVANDPNGADLPAENKPDSNSLANYHVAADLPRILTISKLNVSAKVTRLGTKADGSIMAPNNIYDAGWYDGSAKPGEKGAMLIDGHVHGPTAPGVFVDLKNLKAGDLIKVERGDGKQFTYKVVKAQTYDVNNVDMGAVLSPVIAGKPGLNLMTCTGKFDAKSGEYQQRLAIFAVQI